MQTLRTTLAILALLMLPVAGRAQAVPDDPATDLTGTTVSLLTGEIDGAQTLPAGTELSSATGYGAALSHWFLPWFGIRARALRSDQRITETRYPALQDRLGSGQATWLVAGDALLRAPVSAGDVRLLPYLSLGIGAKRYELETATTDLAFDGGAGLGVRYGPVGVFGEMDRLFSAFDSVGRTEFAHEWLFSGGLSLDVDGLI